MFQCCFLCIKIGCVKYVDICFFLILQQELNVHELIDIIQYFVYLGTTYSLIIDDFKTGKLFLLNLSLLNYLGLFNALKLTFSHKLQTPEYT
jgi:hypothetical protein